MSEDSADVKNGKEASPARSAASSSSNRDKRTSRSRSGSRRRSASRSPGSTRRRHQGDREVPTPSRCLGVFGLSLHTQTRHLREVFSKYGQIEEITIVSDAQTGRSRGFAFVYFDSIEEAENAKEACNGIEIDCRKIRVDFSITKRPHTPTPGIYMGRPTHRPRPRRGGYGYDDRYEDRYDDRYDDRYEDRYDRRYDRRSYRSPPNYRRYRRSRSHSPYGGGYGSRYRY